MHAANRNWYRVELPDSTVGFIQSSRLVSIAKPIKALKISPQQQMVFDKPDTGAALKTVIPVNTSVELLGYFGNYTLIKGLANTTGWVQTSNAL
ncbi:MAG: hypothetical protein EOO39_30290 [Cytophagaceae bacterium]|nr:MAG: hypothetical protein EOO39_30290 [Cytophagaceae bacterium]